jgi:hypothetical protein
MVNKARKVFEPLLDVALSSHEVRQRGCTGCQSRCGDFAGSAGQKIGKSELDRSALAAAIMHTLGIPILLATTLVGLAAATGFGDGPQLVALVLGLAIGAFMCRPLSASVLRQ